MEPDFRPSPNCESTRKWLEDRLHLQDRRMEQSVEQGVRFVQVCSSVKSFTPQEVAERVKHQRLKDKKVVYVRGFNTTLPDTDILKAISERFSSCGEILKIQLTPHISIGRAAIIHILGEDAKEKAKQLNGSDLGGCKLDVMVKVACSSVKPIHGGYTFPESVRRELDLKEGPSDLESELDMIMEAKRAKTMKLSLEKKESEAL